MPTKESQSLVLVSKQNGFVVIPMATPLTRLNYFDGKFLRASDLKTEQDYLRQLVRQSNQAGGAGVAHGFDVTLGGGDVLNIGPGLAIDAEGRVLLLPQGSSVGVQELIDKSRSLQRLYGKSNVIGAGNFEACEMTVETPAVNQQQPGTLYVVVVSAAEALCGVEDVYGKLCEEACATSTDRPFAVEGVVVRAIPLVLKSPYPSSKAAPPTQVHLRSRVASAYFADERSVIASLISAEGLKQTTWCLGADAAADGGVPIGVIARAGATTVFLDPWMVRRELIDTPARRYWQSRMMMRPWDVFLAQILQFQCQLRDLFRQLPAPGIAVDPCAGARDSIQEAATTVDELQKYFESTAQRFIELRETPIPFEGGSNRLSALGLRLKSVHNVLSALPEDRWLINGGIVELPSAGYLPVVPGTNLTINQQVRSMMGEGVDLRFCVVRPDYVAHALEEAQHLERISLTEGLDDPRKKPQVDILVPDGEIIEDKPVARDAFEATVEIMPDYVTDLIYAIAQAEPFSQTVNDVIERLAERRLTLTFNGAARHEAPQSGGHNFYAAMLLNDSFLQELVGSFFSLGNLSFGGANAAVENAKGAEKIARDDAAIEAGSSRLFSRLKTAAAKRRDRTTQPQVAERKAAAPSGIFAEALANALSPGALTGSETEPLIPAGLWLVANCDQDPQSVRPNQTLHINGRFVIGAQLVSPTGISPALLRQAPRPLGIPAYFDLRVSIDAFIDDAGTRPDGGGFINCRASVFGSIIAGFRNSKDSDAKVVNVEVEVNWSGPASGAGNNIRVRVTDPESRATVEFNGHWGGSPQGIEGTVTTAKVDDFRFGLRANPDVLQLENDRHQRAVKALHVIGSALKNPAFVTTSSAQLFPPPPKPTDDLIVRGTKDWVLFHRRRNKNCGIATVAPATRRYRVYQFAATPERIKELGVLADAAVPQTPPTTDQILKASPNLPKVYLPIGEATFAGGVATLVGDTSALKTAWEKIPNGEILWAGIGSRGDALTDGAALAQFRLKALESTLDQVAPNARADVLPIIPPSLASPGFDGIILLANAAPTKADLNITKTVAPLQFRADGQLTYTLTLTNKGSAAAQNVIVNDPLPPNTSFAGAPTPVGWTPTTPPLGATSGSVSFRKASFAAGDTATFQILVKVLSSTGGAAVIIPSVITNTVTVESSTGDPITATATSTLETPWIMRLMVQRGDVNGTRILAPTDPQELIIQFGRDGSLRGLPGTVLNAIKAATGAKLDLVELAASDALAATRLNFLFLQLGFAGLLEAGATKQVVALRNNEQPLLQLSGGVHADDIAFVSVIVG
jgi:uncharacterized repeat protein (TIGR01451 family)